MNSYLSQFYGQHRSLSLTYVGPCVVCGSGMGCLSGIPLYISRLFPQQMFLGAESEHSSLSGSPLFTFLPHGSPLTPSPGILTSTYVSSAQLLVVYLYLLIRKKLGGKVIYSVICVYVWILSSLG